MRLPEEYRKCVVFIGVEIDKGSETSLEFAGTGFLVTVKSETLDLFYKFVVTAKHSVDRMLQGNWRMRLNLASGGVIDIQGNKDVKWLFHPTEADRVDVAVLPFPHDENIDETSVPLTMFLTEQRIQEFNIGEGDEVYIPGLFKKMGETPKNMPIVRSGNVALLPDSGTLIPGIKLGGRAVEAEVYLVEARSIGGLSGSPAFVRATLVMTSTAENKAIGKKARMEWSVPGPYSLLGLIHGHWEVDPEELNAYDPRSVPKDKGVNMGIAIVVPAKKIMEVLLQPAILEKMKASDQAFLSQQRAT